MKAPGQRLSAVFAPDGERGALVTLDGWCALTGADVSQTLALLNENETPITAATFSPDGQRVLTIGIDRSFQVWDARTGRKHLSVTDHPGDVTLAQFSPGGDELLTLSSEGTVYLWDAETGKRTHQIQRTGFGPGRSDNQGFERRKYRINRDGSRVLVESAGQEATVEVLDAATGEQLLKVPNVMPSDMNTLSPDGRRLLVVKSESSTRQHQFVRDRARPPKSLAIADRTREIPIVVDVQSGETVSTFSDLEFYAEEAAFSSDAARVVLTSSDAIVVWSVEENAEVARLPEQIDQESLRIQPNGSLIFAIRFTGEPILWDPENAQPAELIGGSAGAVSGSFSPDGELLAIVSADKSVQLWDVATLSRQGEPLRGHLQAIEHAVISADRNWLATVAGRRVRVWKLDPIEPWVTVSHMHDVESAQFVPQSDALVTYTPADKRPYVWPLDLPRAAKERLSRELTPMERQRFAVGSRIEQVVYDDRQRSDRTQAELRLAVDQASQNPGVPAATDWLKQAIASLLDLARSDFTTEAESASLLESATSILTSAQSQLPQLFVTVAQVHHAAGELALAIKTLERGLDRYTTDASTRTSAEKLVAALRREALPALPTFRTVDVAMEQADWIISEGDMWKYRKGATPPPGAALDWTKPGYADSEWASGPSGFGYGDDDDATVFSDMRNSYTTVYLRKSLTIEAVQNITQAELIIHVDDGFVAYLNGREIGRSRAGQPGEPQLFDAVATSRVQDSELVRVRIDPQHFTNGTNLLAIQGLNTNRTSSDLTLVPILRIQSKDRVELLRRRFRELLDVKQEPHAAHLSAYIQGRLLAAGGAHDRAIETLRPLAERFPDSPEPHLAIVHSLLEAGQADEALARSRRAVTGPLAASASTWNLWYRVASASDRGLGFALLDELETLEQPQMPTYIRQLRPVWKELREAGVVRINAGARQDYRDSQGQLWMADRFSLGGDYGRSVASAGQSDDFKAVYVAERYFKPLRRALPGYRIPLPNGRYKISLHFAEVYYKRRGTRIFDVTIEEKKVIERYEPLAKGFATPERFDFDVEVLDRFLDVSFVHVSQNPKIAAIEIKFASAATQE